MKANKKQSKKRISYKNKFNKRDRAIKIIKELSEFLRVMDIRESDILKTMLVRFAIESVEASLGSMLTFNKSMNGLVYHDTYLYEKNKIVLEDYRDRLKSIVIPSGTGAAGEAYQKEIPVWIEDVESSGKDSPPIAKILEKNIKSVIAIPLKVDDEIIGVLEIGKSTRRPALTSDDCETIMIIANFASTILENAKFLNLATHDNLTGLYNNHYFYKEVNDKVELSKKYGNIFSLVMFDIDDFKNINDGYGHPIGDKVLKLLAECINKTIRNGVDIAARYGGDEFVIVLPNTNGTDAYKVSKRLLALVTSSSIITQTGKAVTFTLSIGISEFPKDGEKVYSIFNYADEALYRSKAAGKNTITIYAPQN